MSKVKIQGSASGNGILTIQAPTTSTDRTITLPDSTGTILDENSSLPAANLTGTVADARISTLTASKLTGALPAISGASLTGVNKGITHASSFKIPSAILVTNNTTWIELTTWVDMAGSNHTPNVGADVTHSSGVFTFPTTGIYWIHYVGRLTLNGNDTSANFILETTNDNSTWSNGGYATGGNGSGTNAGGSASGNNIFDVQDTSNYKIRFSTGSFGTATNLNGITSDNRTHFIVIRLGDT